MDKTEKRICWYSSLLIALLMSSPRFLALRENGIIAHYWHFNLAELIFQLLSSTAFCYLLFHLNLNRTSALFISHNSKKYLTTFFLNFVVLFFFCLTAGIIQRHVFFSGQLRNIYWSGYFSRYVLSGLLAGILIKIILLLRESKQKDKENEQLKTAHLEAELELLKEQLNPHFLFNSLSTLSGIVREDPVKAQHFINHLSKIFRYALTQAGNQLVSLGDELKMITSYEQLLVMRFEKAFQLTIDIDEKFNDVLIPHLTLQPLIENAAKHNAATVAKPLKVKVYITDNMLVVCNNLNIITEPEHSTGIGLANLNSRFSILMHHEIEIEQSAEYFIVKLPLNI
ncbi:MAG: histidine kinase [Bacteroidota bacterium]|nr:histidine kinase [Bacteroidota bacterium]